MKEYIIKVNVNGKLADECLNVLQSKELIRCKDCIYWFESGGVYCCKKLTRIQRNPDWYCADGEKR